MEELFYGILSYALDLDPAITFPPGYGHYEQGIHPALFQVADSEFIAEAQACEYPDFRILAPLTKVAPLMMGSPPSWSVNVSSSGGSKL